MKYLGLWSLGLRKFLWKSVKSSRPPPPAYLMYAPLLEINAIRAKSQLGTEEIRVKVKLLELHLMPAILHGLTVCGRILTRE